MNFRWRIFSVLAFLYLLAYFYRVSMAVLAEDLSRELSISAVQLGTLSGAFFYAFAFTQLPLGPLLDRYGGKRVVVITGTLTTLGAVIFAVSHHYPTALAGRILLGIGTASVLMGSLRIFTNWFDVQEFGRTSGFIIAIGNIGNIAATAPLAWAANTIGWRTTFLGIAGIQALALVMAHFTVTESPRLTDRDRPQTPSFFSGVREVLTTPSYWLISFLAFSWYASYMAVQGLWGGPYLMEIIGLSKEGAGRVLMATSLGFLVGCLFVGEVTKRVFRSPKGTLFFGQLFMSLCMMLLVGPLEHLPRPLLTPIFFVMGLAVSSGVAVYPLIREGFPHAIIGSALTSVNFFILLGAASVQQIMGFVISGFHTTVSGGYPADAYHQAFMIPLLLLCSATLLFIGVRTPVRPRDTEKSGH